MVRAVACEEMDGSEGPVSAARYAKPSSGARRTHVSHSHAALAFYTAGATRMEQGGEWNVTAGDVLLVPAGTPHRVVENRRPEYWVVTFALPCFTADEVTALVEPLERVRDGAAAVAPIPAARHGLVEELLRELATSGAAAPAVVQRSLLTLILHEVGQAARLVHAPATAPGVVAESLRFIERNCLRRLTLDEVAAAVHRSPAYVTDALAKATGRSANEWIVSGRMAEGRRRLLHSDELVEVIAERVGYADATHFIRMFRRHHGTTPTAWRAARRAVSGGGQP